MTALPWLEPRWSAAPRVRGAFTLRAGGVSVGPFAALNVALHVGDDPQAVRENRRRLRATLGLPGEPCWLGQVHGTQVLQATATAAPTATANGPSDPPPLADAAVTADRGVVLAIQVADCLPVLFAARDGSCVGAAHAGWRGLAAGVLESTVAALAGLGAPAGGLAAWIGPGIGSAHFEVGPEVRDAFVTHDREAEAAFARNARGRWQCDLERLARQRLAALGVMEAAGGGWCTYADPERFFSFRREPRCGRHAALVWIG